MPAPWSVPKGLLLSESIRWCILDIRNITGGYCLYAGQRVAICNGETLT